MNLLGLYIDKMNFNYHISHLCHKDGRRVQVLCRLSKVIDISNKLLLYNSFIECYFNYCSVLWHFCSEADTYKLERLQKKALRFIMLNFTCTYAELLHSCNQCTMYTLRSDVTYLRSCHTMSLPKFKTVTYGNNSVSYKAPLIWNSFNNYFKNSSNVR